MGMACRAYACTQICEVEVCFTTKLGSKRPTNRVCNNTKSQQIDLKHLLFAHFIIADVTSELKTVPSQKLHLAHFTRYTVHRPNHAHTKLPAFAFICFL